MIRISDGLVHNLPIDLVDAISQNTEAIALWEGLTPIGRNEFICWIEDVKQEKTRKKTYR
ncbi:YdeI/OmpD-associated family protein [Cellvibrio fontiphilus]|jgi:uncharacterized protein YdeI (YjbR/CyaY-like superfamily)|uniref:YdeI/OmpD-associated family protein n=1 Tax=Cellvibrio fontiphilus TaxID=1815559 RepID=A0ABV7FCH2_9GAMM